MFSFLGKLVTRSWPLWLAFWIIALVATSLAAPSWDKVPKDGDFALLPASAPTRLAQALFQKAFPDDRSASNLVVVLSRDDGKLTTEDRAFIENALGGGLLKIANDEGGLAGAPLVDNGDPFAEQPKKSDQPHSIIAHIMTPGSPGIGALLNSEDGKAALVVLDLTTDLMSHDNWATIGKVKGLVAQLREQGKVPAGLGLAMTGSALIGHDFSMAELQSVHAIEFWTMTLVVTLLLVIYRAPLLALIPLVTVYLAVRLALNVLCLLASAGYIRLFEGIQIYTTVIAYGAGVDYCLFLAARYKEELDACVPYKVAMSRALSSVGGALTASAATVMFGIGMMAFAQFGKFQEAGIAMPLSLVLVLLATLTFTASLLCLVGRWAFWPEFPCQHGRNAPPAGNWGWIVQAGGTHWLWERLTESLTRRPGMIWIATVVLLLPFAVTVGLMPHALTYDFIGDLPANATSVIGTKALQQHFSPGLMGPLTVVIEDPHANFREPKDRRRIEELTERLSAQRQALGLSDVRTLTAPLGVTPAADQALKSVTGDDAKRDVQRQALDHYASEMGERGYTVTRVDLVLAQNPFSHASVDAMKTIEAAVRAALPGDASNLQFGFVGATASIRDLREVTNSDQERISLLVVSAVFVILLVLLRDFVVSVYLILSVLFSYFVTLGATLLFFWALNPTGFAGLDWKVGIFLFTILIAVGEDYNIFLMARVHEEQRRLGNLRGTGEALARTGPIISSCGIIMAGTFASLAAGPLAEMHQLAFALAFGVLLDTFVVRPVLVPTFLMMLHRSPRPATVIDTEREVVKQ
jgi:RND superfamily putative drug exporter